MENNDLIKTENFFFNIWLRVFVKEKFIHMALYNMSFPDIWFWYPAKLLAGRISGRIRFRHYIRFMNIKPKANFFDMECFFKVTFLFHMSVRLYKRMNFVCASVLLKPADKILFREKIKNPNLAYLSKKAIRKKLLGIYCTSFVANFCSFIKN